MMTTNTSLGNPPQSGASVQEYKIRVPKNVKKKHHVMRFNATLNVDFANWTHVKMERENNIKEFKGTEEDMPKFGAGSEYGRDVREEARRKKFGIMSRKYKPEDQPWILKVGGSKTGKKFKGIREGGVSENAAYYVFTHAADGAIDAYPLQEWYNFQPIQRYKALSAEEAEQEFGRRNKVINYFSLMFRKRMRGGDDADDIDDPDEKKTKGKAKKDLKISEMDEWINSDDESSDSEAQEKDNDSDAEAKKKKKKGAAPKKKKKVEDEAFEESDDGDEEGRERDYISDSSDSDSDHETKANKELKGVAEEDALRKLLTSDEDSEQEQEEKQESEQEDEPTKEGEERASKLTKKKKKPDDTKKADSSSDFSSDSDSEPESGAAKKPKKSKSSADRSGSAPNTSASAPGSASTSRAGTPSPSAAQAAVAAANAAAALAPPSKRPKLDLSYTECGVTEEAVRRYLARKPMTTTELLTKFKSKRTGVSSERLVETMTQILKRINPFKQNINGKMYLSIKQT